MKYATNFMSLLFDGGIEDALITACFKRKGDREFQSKWFNCNKAGLEEIVETCEGASNNQYDAYFSVCPAKPGTKGDSKHRIKQDQVGWIPAFFLDCDIYEPEKKGKIALPGSQEEALKALHSLQYPPTACVNSGSGIHAYWVFDKWQDCTAESKTALRQFADAVANITGFTDLDTHASEPSRILRMPGTKNFKHDEQDVCVVDSGNTRYTYDKLAQWAKDNAPSPTQKNSAKIDWDFYGEPAIDWRGTINGIRKDKRKSNKAKKFLSKYDTPTDAESGRKSEDDFSLMDDLAHYLDRDPCAVREAFLNSARGASVLSRKSRPDVYLRTSIDKAVAENKGRSEYMEAMKEQKKQSNISVLPVAQQITSTGATDISNNSAENNKIIPNVSDVFPIGDFTDVGQARMLCKLYKKKLRYNAGTKWLVYDGKKWTTDNDAEKNIVQELTQLQLDAAREHDLKCVNAQVDAIEQNNTDEEAKARKNQQQAKIFLNFAKKERSSSRIAAALEQAKGLLHIEARELDNDVFALNTPDGTIDLQSGELKQHNSDDFCTKITGCAPSDKGHELFESFLDRITCNNVELQEYLQNIAGLITIGRVYREILVIAYGAGGNGKSTLFNLLRLVLGDYARMAKAGILVSDKHKNTDPEYADLRGRRLVIASELDEGLRFDMATVKQLVSTDPIKGAAKFKDAIEFDPSHTLVLYTNHLPKVRATDKGTWDRLIVVPFNASIRGEKEEILNYTEYLYTNAGGAVLSWMIKGAQRVIEHNFKFAMPACVEEAIAEYRGESEWIEQYISARCDINPTYKQPSGELYIDYRAYCESIGEIAHSKTDFKTSIERKGYEYHKTKTGAYVYGFQLKNKNVTIE